MHACRPYLICIGVGPGGCTTGVVRNCYAQDMIEVEHLTKSFRGKKAIDDVTFTVPDGRVTGFLGPNGAGKSTTMRACLALIKPEKGRALIDGRPFTKLESPMTSVGAVLNPRSAHKSRSAYAHLRSLAASNGIPVARVDEVMEMVGLTGVKNKSAGSFSLGMSQRLSIAAALLGDPRNLVLDEPINGLDPDGVKWVRELCRSAAAQGKAVLLSSHLMSEVALTADDLVIIGQGRIMERTTVGRFIQEHSHESIRAVTPQPNEFMAALSTAAGIHITRLPSDSACPPDAALFRIEGAPLASTATILANDQVVLYEFCQEKASLEEAYMKATHGQVEYRSRVVADPEADARNKSRGGRR